MKKLFLIPMAALLFSACGGDKSKSGNEPTASEPKKEEVKPAATGEDAALTSWLSGKMLTSTAVDPKQAMFDHLKLNADGTCTDKDNAAAKWKIENGEFVFMAAMEMRKKIEKKDDNTVVFKGVVGDDTYTLSAAK